MVFFRIDLNQKNGLGHYYRIKSLIKHLKIKKYKIIIETFLEQDFFKNEKKNFLYLYNSKKKFKNEKEDEKKFIKITKINHKRDVVIKDSYKLNYLWEKKIAKHCKKIFIIDDFPKKKHFADYYINHNPAFDNLDASCLSKLKKNNKKNCKFLLGSGFSLFNTNFDKKNKNSSDYVFYSGGSGNPLVYEKIIINLLKIKFKIIIILGPLISKKNYNAVSKKFGKFANIKIVFQPQNILNFLSKTKVFVSTAGVSIFESSFLKVPTLVIKMFANQNLHDSDYEKLGHYITLDKKDLKSEDKVTSLLKLMIDNSTLLKNLMVKSTLNVEAIKRNYRLNIKF